LLAAQFQGFCRDLHSECVDSLVGPIPLPDWQQALQTEFLWNRKLDHGNPNPGNIGADFSRLGLDFWQKVEADDTRNAARKRFLDELNEWRNAIAHHDFDPVKLGGAVNLRLRRVRHWRNVCQAVAASFDRVMTNYVHYVTGLRPW
jgi:hypothetical protein